MILLAFPLRVEYTELKMGGMGKPPFRNDKVKERMI